MITPSFGITATERVLPRMALDFTTASLDPRVTFTRTGNTATVTNSSGYVVGINADLPRFDFNPITLVCKGLLIEESRTNLLLQSSDFSTSWVGEGVSVTTNQVNSPSNVQDADLLDATTGFCRIKQNANISGSIAYTFSGFFKKQNKSTVGINFLTTGGANPTKSGDLIFNFDTLVVSSTGDVVNPTVTAYQNGFYRISGTLTSSATHSISATNIYPAGAFGATGQVYAWGAQLEAGAFATSYIPTTTLAVARNADVATMTGTNFSDWYNAGAGGAVARVLPSTVSGTRPALQFDDATANEVIALRGDTTNPELVIVDGGSPQAQIDAGTIAANTAYNLGVAWNTDNCAAAVNGGAAVTDTSATIPTVTQARLGSDGTNYLNGNIQTLRYWPQRIIDAEVQAFSK